MNYLILGLLCLFSLNVNGQTMNIIQEKISKLFIASDQGDWETVQQCFAEQVILDYASMTGQAASTVTAQQITESWQSVLPGFEYTHHQLGNFIIQKATDSQASVFCYGTATHYIENEQENLWTVVGSYNFDLEKYGSDWKITQMKFNFKYQLGNTNLPQLAISRLNKQTLPPSTAEQHKATVRQFLKTLEEKQLDNLVELFAQDAEHINPYHSNLFPKGAKGQEEIRAYWQPVFLNFGKMEFPIQEIYAMENPNIIYVKFGGKIQYKDQDAYYENDYYATFKFDDNGKIVEYVEIFNPITAAKAFDLLDKIK